VSNIILVSLGGDNGYLISTKTTAASATLLTNKAKNHSFVI